MTAGNPHVNQKRSGRHCCETHHGECRDTFKILAGAQSRGKGEGQESVCPETPGFLTLSTCSRFSSLPWSWFFSRTAESRSHVTVPSVSLSWAYSAFTWGRTHTHTRTHVCTRTGARTHTHTHTRTQTYTDVHTCKHTHRVRSGPAGEWRGHTYPHTEPYRVQYPDTETYLWAQRELSLFCI